MHKISKDKILKIKSSAQKNVFFDNKNLKLIIWYDKNPEKKFYIYSVKSKEDLSLIFYAVEVTQNKIEIENLINKFKKYEHLIKEAINVGRFSFGKFFKILENDEIIQKIKSEVRKDYFYEN